MSSCSWELLYADDLMISAESIEELLVKFKAWISEMEKKDEHEKDKDYGDWHESGSSVNICEGSLSVRLEKVATQSSVMAACDGYTENAVTLRAPCALTQHIGAPRPALAK